MHRKRARRILGDLKKSAVEFLARKKTDGFRLLAEALRRVHTCCGGRGGTSKSQNRKNVYLSPYVEEPLNSKVIKSFVPELRSRKCFSCFGMPVFYVYMLWTFYVRFPYPYWIPPGLTLSIIRYGSRVKWSNPGKGVVPSPTPCCSCYLKGSLRVCLDYGRQLYSYTICLHKE